jgi:hypothetical protein
MAQDRDESDPGREAVHEALQKLGPPDAILTGWVVVAEWMTQDGARALGRARAADTTPWTAKGMIHTVLFEGTDGWGAPE